MFLVSLQKQSLLSLILLMNLAVMHCAAYSHEIRPSIVDLFVDNTGIATLVIDLNIEALIADVGSSHMDTSESDNAEEYKRLRRLLPEQLQRSFMTFSTDFISGINLTTLNKSIPLTVTHINIAELGDIELARNTRITLQAELPANAASLRWQWNKAYGAAVLRFSTDSQQDRYTAYLKKGESSAVMVLDTLTVQSKTSLFINYLAIGFSHILPKGLDHILFVVGLFLLSIKAKALIWQVSSFTLAHTVTLALGMLGWVQISPSIVEPLIAASIVYVCVENIYSDHLSRWRPIVVFGFGLLHGLGFAGVLMGIGLSPNNFFTGLLAFNIGVELGQLTVIFLCFLVLGFWFKEKAWYRKRVTIPASFIIALIGSYWFVERALLDHL